MTWLAAADGAPGARWYLFLGLLIIALVGCLMRIDGREARREARRREREHEYERRHRQQDLQPYDWRKDGV